MHTGLRLQLLKTYISREKGANKFGVNTDLPERDLRFRMSSTKTPFEKVSNQIQSRGSCFVLF